MSRPARVMAEWVTFGASLAVVVALVVVILALWAGGESPASVRVERDGIRRGEDGAYLVDASVSNDGDATAANVQVLATLTIDGTETQVEQVVDFVAGGEQEALVFVFVDDPADGELELGVASFADP